jgi:phenylacetate-CoA ligase
MTLSGQAYGNPFIETLPREQLQQIQITHFRRILSYAKSHTEFYGRRYRQIEPEDIRTLDDIQSRPPY